MATEKDISKYRIEQAEECLETAKDNLAISRYKAAANRSYYCIFNAMRSILALDKVDFKKHSAVIGYFRENYIKTGIFDRKMSDIIKILFQVRNESDYNDFYVVVKNEVENQIKQAEHFLSEVKKYLKQR